ncbi:hypothetical protein SARC_13176, partial [Sphaeroforma arctica JP610]
MAIAATNSQSRLRLRHIPRWEPSRSNGNIARKRKSTPTGPWGPIDSRTAGFKCAFDQILHYNWLPPPSDVRAEAVEHKFSNMEQTKPSPRKNSTVRSDKISERTETGGKPSRLQQVGGLCRDLAEHFLRFNITWLDSQSSDYSLNVGTDNFVLASASKARAAPISSNQSDHSMATRPASHSNTTSNRSSVHPERTTVNLSVHPALARADTGNISIGQLTRNDIEDGAAEEVLVQTHRSTPELSGELWTDSDRRVLNEDCI